MDEPELAKSKPEPPKQPWAILLVAVTLVISVFLPGVAAIGCLIVGIANWDAHWIKIAAVWGLFTFLGWYMMRRAQWPKLGK